MDSTLAEMIAVLRFRDLYGSGQFTVLVNVLPTLPSFQERPASLFKISSRQAAAYSGRARIARCTDDPVNVSKWRWRKMSTLEEERKQKEAQRAEARGVFHVS
jgi:hypothetical protein